MRKPESWKKTFERLRVSKLFFLALLAAMIYFFVRSLFHPIRKPSQKPEYRKRGGEPATEMVQDPICGIFIDPKKSASLECRGVFYYFCSELCEAKFRKQLQQGEKI